MPGSIGPRVVDLDAIVIDEGLDRLTRLRVVRVRNGVDEQLANHHARVLRQRLALKPALRDRLGLTGVAPDEALHRIDRLQHRQLLLGIEQILDVRCATAAGEARALDPRIAKPAPPEGILAEEDDPGVRRDHLALIVRQHTESLQLRGADRDV
ncbi:MAG: hypothetical protein ABSH36_14145, partial [Solirubrobacteraceae bacterium]